MRKIKFLVIFIIFVFGGYFLVKNSGLFVAKKFIEKEFAKATQAELNIGSLNVSLLKGTVTVNHVHIHDRGNSIFKLGMAHVNFDLFPLLKKKIIIHGVKIEDPWIYVKKEKNNINLSKLSASQRKTASVKEEKSSPKKAKPFDYTVSVENVWVNNFKFSFQEKFPDTQFEYVIDKGYLTAHNVKYPEPMKVPLTLKMRVPEKAQFDYQGTFISKKNKELSLESTLKIKDVTVAVTRDLIGNYFNIYPTGGTAHLTSKAHLQGSILRSEHELQLHKLKLEQGRNVASALGGAFLAFIQGPQGDKLELRFRIDGDIKDPNFSWVSGISQAVAEAFQKQLSRLQKITDILKKPTKEGGDLLQDLKDALPF
ncbi:MAG: DUF748 domain-containing protein [Deltaproteobacteria bacterium]|nr:DUF748 domain-containing protein [Deltaproteobacteria bacterium]